MAKAAPFAVPPLEPAFPLFHWSPYIRRNQIERKGLVPGSRSIDGVWKPPYVCFSPDPELAWALSGRIHPEVEMWDLWMTWSNVPRGMEACIDCARDTGKHYVKEYRVYERIFKRDIWHVGCKAGAER
jgi:hypothetical protein